MTTQPNLPLDEWKALCEKATLETKWSKSLQEKLQNKEYRDSFTQESTRLSIALDVRRTRQHYEMTQKDLAEKIGSKQSVIARIEDPDYEGTSLNTLLKVANAFDLQLRVELTPISENTAGERIFIAAAREAMPQLIAEVERLRAENEQLKGKKIY